MIDIILDTLLDTVKLIPFLFVTYLLMELIEHKTGEKAKAAISKAGSFGPVIGSLLGAFPQCGFSASASGLYAGGVVSAGTLIAVFLATSDEMLPVCISEHVSAGVIAKILINKVVLGILIGFTVDIVLKILKKDNSKKDIHSLCQNDDCHCEEGSVLRSALHHTLHITVFIFIIVFVMNLIIGFVGEERLGRAFVNIPVVGCAVSALIGLIPNCAASVVITELYLQGIISTGCMMSGLLAGSGLGLLILFRINKNLRQNAAILLTVYFSSVLIGIIFEVLKISF
ncbi:MAG: arsenic efflux protein [Clostridiales bacterium]|nr:arsenic efflux protein [Clostridiales bacterium]